MENLPNWIGLAMGVIPAVAILICVKGQAPSSLFSLISGLLLVAVATLTLGFMTDFMPVYEILEKDGALNSAQSKNAQSSIGLWQIMFPAIVGAIGANYITSWVQSSGKQRP